MKWRLLTFGGGSPRYEGAAFRLAREAHKTDWFDAIEVETAGTLASRHPEFWRMHRSFVTSHPRLFGYAIWKPYLIRVYLEELRPNWGLIYLDAGCVLNSNPKAQRRLHSYLDVAANCGLWATCLDAQRWGYPSFPEECWTKSDALDAIHLDGAARRSPQYQSGMIMLTPSTSTRQLVTEWETLSTCDDYHLSTDAPSRQDEAACFLEHRHDQSLFSITAKKLRLPAVPDETWFAPAWFLRGRTYPIWAARWRYPQAMQPWDWRYVQRVVRRTWTNGGRSG